MSIQNDSWQIQSPLLKGIEHEAEVQTYKELLEPPNPIITKSVIECEKASFKFSINDNNKNISNGSFALNKKQEEENAEKNEKNILYRKNRQKIQLDEEMDQMTLLNAYNENDLIFKKFENKYNQKRNGKQYYASYFVTAMGGVSLRMPEYKGMLVEDDLQFSSKHQSGNLYAVYKIRPDEYDLILQNDFNTSGFTQWFNFIVKNKNRKNFKVKFNIVNLVILFNYYLQYKSKSLYNFGMKPIVRSEKSDKNTKNWRRKGFNIYYQKNSISYEDNLNKCYKSLTFQYDFTVENDTVLFAHAIPYDLTDLKKTIKNIQQSAKVSIKSIGNTPLGRSIPLIKIHLSQKSQKYQKKAIIILARQHPGQTPSSYIVEEIMNDLLKSSLENQFLMWRFDFYIFPMVNIDGVAAGNYRSNLFGFDLNRCWDKTDKEKQPQVYLIKNEIKKIMKKQNIELILDLHGHSRKMNSFFYGNTFGKNPMLFPYIASKSCPYVSFDDSKFSSDKASKATTARVVLGNMIKETGNVYTYEVTFFGSYKNGNQATPLSFSEENYKQLGRNLVSAIYKTYLELYKEEKTLKESLFLKDIKKQIKNVNPKLDSEEDSGSDSEAEKMNLKEIQEIDESIKNYYENAKQQKMIQNQNYEIINNSKDKSYKFLPVEAHDLEIKDKLNSLLQKNQNNNKNQIILERSNLFASKQKAHLGQIILKEYEEYHLRNAQKLKKNKYYTDKLKIRGETFQLAERNQLKNSSETLGRNEMNSYSLPKSLNKKSTIISILSPPMVKKQKQFGINSSLQTINIQLNQQQLSSPSKNIEKVILYRRNKYRNVLTHHKDTLPLSTSTNNQQTMADVVIVNRLEYQRIKRQSSANRLLSLAQANLLNKYTVKLPQI